MPFPSRAYRCVVKDGADVGVGDLVKGVKLADAVGKDFVEHKADASACAQPVRERGVQEPGSGT